MYHHVLNYLMFDIPSNIIAFTLHWVILTIILLFLIHTHFSHISFVPWNQHLMFLFLCSSLEVRTSSWSGPSGRASERSRRGWGGCSSRSSRTWSWPSLSARPTCPPPEPDGSSHLQSSSPPPTAPPSHLPDSSPSTDLTLRRGLSTNLRVRPVIPPSSDWTHVKWLHVQQQIKVQSSLNYTAAV